MAPLVQLLSTVQGASALAVLVLLLVAEGAHPFFAFWKDGRARRVHAVRNLAFGLVNSLLVAVVFAGVWLAVAEWTNARGVGLLNVLREAAGLPLWAHVALAVLLLDVWTYAWHRLNHRVPLLWRFHRVHHADAEMDVTTAGRFHTGEIVLSSLLRDSAPRRCSACTRGSSSPTRRRCSRSCSSTTPTSPCRRAWSGCCGR